MMTSRPTTIVSRSFQPMSSLAQPRLRRAEQGRRAERRADLANTLRTVRERLAFRRPLPLRLERELLVRHAQSLTGAAAILPIPILAAGAGLWLIVGAFTAAFWTLAASAAGLLLLSFAGRLAAAKADTVRPDRWSAVLLAGHLGLGLAFASLALVDCSSCRPLEYEIYLLAAVLLAVSTVAVISSMLRGAVLLGFSPLFAVLVGRAMDAPDAPAAAILVIAAASVPLFAFVASRLRIPAIERFAHHAEKDELIAALEEERVASVEARRRAEDASHAKSRFLATMSHELRTPLNAILGFSEVITKEILGPVGNPTYKEYVGDIHASGRHLLDLINEILDLSRVEAGRYALNEEAVDLVAVTADCRNYLQMKARAKGVSLTLRAEDRLPLLWGDRRALRQVVLNLLSNAVKFTAENSEIVLRVGWTAGGGQYVSIRDEGPGIPTHEIPTVLSSFGQGSSALKSAEQGTGLGLPIVQALVHLHDGEFRLDSAPGRGTEAIAIFPHSRVLEIMPAMPDYL